MRIAEFLIAGVLATSVGTFAVSRSSSARSSRSYSSHSTSHTSTTRSTASRPPTWSSTRNYGSTHTNRVGTGRLYSSTTPPAPHTYKGKKYNSAEAIYTNTSGFWVYYWLTTNHKTQCFDKNHKPISCTRNNKSIAKDW